MNKPIDVALGVLLERREVPESQEAGVNPDGLDSVAGGGEGLEVKILITRRLSHMVYGGYWEFPGGKIEPGETPETALVREFVEELGINILPGLPLDEVVHTYEHAKVRLIPFLCTRQSGTIQNLAVSDHRWIGPESLDEHDFPEANLTIIKQLKSIFEKQCQTIILPQADRRSGPKAGLVGLKGEKQGLL